MLSDWEDHFRDRLAPLAPADRRKAGALLRTIPDRGAWDSFIREVRQVWGAGREAVLESPHSLVVLYGGLAFYKYESNSFWPQFAETMGDSISPREQGLINQSFAKSCTDLAFPLLSRAVGEDFVGSAVFHIGIPLSVWDEFLDLCSWALAEGNWESLREDEWAAAVARQTVSQTRLRRFLTANRESARFAIREMLEAREILIANPSLSVEDLKQASLLRQEYFDEVPETAEFLRPGDPESLRRNTIRLTWSEVRSEIALHLPAVAARRLPAKWDVSGRGIDASITPTALALNEQAFRETLAVTLTGSWGSDTHLIRGVVPWGLAEVASGRFVNAERARLPMRGYFLVSAEPFLSVERIGFETDDNSVNDPFRLRDGSQCFITRLWPSRSSGTAKIRTKTALSTLRFAAGRHIEARLFSGQGVVSAFRTPQADRVDLEGLPELLLLVPKGYFGDNRTQVQSRFQVVVDDGGTLRAFGRWEPRYEGDNQEIYHWVWSGRGIDVPRPARTYRSLSELDPSAHRRADLVGPKDLTIAAESIGLQFRYKVNFLKPVEPVSRAWSSLPGRYLLWFLLCQNPEGCTWDDLQLSRIVISANDRVDFKQLKLLVSLGMVRRRGNAWQIAESRAVLQKANQFKWNVFFCGDPSILWRLYRHVRTERLQHHSLDARPAVSVTSESLLSPLRLVQQDSGVFCLEFTCNNSSVRTVRRFLDRHAVRFVADLAKG